MKIAYKHLLDHIYSQASIEDLSEKLFQLGHEHEIQDEIFDIEFTPNRGDCLSLKGLLQDLNVFYDIKFNFGKYEKEIPSLKMNFVNNAKSDCQSISFLKIEIDGNIKKYNDRLEDYFGLFDVNKKNFFADISNYLSYEMGQPTHCYDFNKIDDPLTLEESSVSCNFNTLLDKEITLTKKNLVFVSNNKIINLAGIVGGKDSACSDNTNTVLVECASFNPEKIIGKSLMYGIQSDAAYKFERGVDPSCHDDVIRRFIYLVQEHANIKSLKLYKNTFKDTSNNLIAYELDTISKIIGSSINQEQFNSHLCSLNFKINGNNIEVPPYRNDIKTQNDLAEELARCIGYNNIDSKPLNIKKRKFKKSIETVNEELIKRLLIDNGFHEAINFPFSKTSSNSIKVDNPIDSNKPYIRENITESLIENLLFNERRQHDSIKLFEISDLYEVQNDKKIKKRKKISIIASGRIGKDISNFSKKIDSKYLDSILSPYIKGLSTLTKEIPRDSLVSKIKSKIFCLELDLSEINKNISSYKALSQPPAGFVKYVPISEFPKIYRDLSFSISEYQSMHKLHDLVTTFKDIYLKEVFIFDFYENLKINTLKVGYRFIFQASEKTLTDNDVNLIIDTLIKKSLKISGIEIPGIKA